MDTHATKRHVGDALAKAYELADELRLLGTTVAARDPLSIALNAAGTTNLATINSLQALQDALPESRED